MSTWSGRHPIAGIAGGLDRHRLLELGEAAGGRVLVVAGIRAGRDGGRHDVGRSREVRLPGAEADDVLAGGDEGLGLGVDGQGGGFRHSGYAL